MQRSRFFPSSTSTDRRTGNRAYLTLGSNIAPAENLPAAVRELATFGTICGISRVWETIPVGFADQPNFLNAALLLETPLSARDLRLHAITEIEQTLNRVRDPHNRNAPRTIDIDIALFNRDVLTIEHRRIPDPDLLERPFLAIPLAELDPDYVHPQAGLTLARIATRFEAGTDEMRLRDDILLT